MKLVVIKTNREDNKAEDFIILNNNDEINTKLKDKWFQVFETMCMFPFMRDGISTMSNGDGHFTLLYES